jgi:hypothetical protein
VALAATVALVALTGCGEGGPGGGTAHACDLLTTEEASDVLGVPALDGVEDDDRTIGGSFCQWRADGTPSGEGDPAYSVYIDVAGDRGPSDFEENQGRGDPTASTGVPAAPVDGIGDEAYFYSLFDDLPSLHVRVGEEYLTIGVSEDDEHPVTVDQAEAMERQMADLAVPRV